MNKKNKSSRRKKLKQQPPAKPSYLRHAFGGMGIFLAGVAVYQVAIKGTTVITESLYMAGALRGGILLAALWLAWPDIQSTKHELPMPLLAAMAILVGVIFIGPQYLLLFAAIVLATVVLFSVKVPKAA